MPYNSPFSALRGLQAPSRVTLAETHAVSATEGTSALGTFRFNASSYASGSTFTFLALASVSDGALTATIVLRNIDDNETLATLTTSSTSPDLQSAVLTVGAGVGELRNTTTTYEVRLSVSGSLVTDIASLGSVSLVIS